MAPYDDERYMQLTEKLRRIISELLAMEGNDDNLIREEVDNAIEEAE